MNRIICIGNRYLHTDAAGVRVHDVLIRRPLPEGVEVIDGGTAGLNLLGLVDGAESVVFVDAIIGFLPSAGVVVLGLEDMPVPEEVYDHGAGLSYLLHIMPRVCDRIPRSVHIVGIEGPVTDQIIDSAAQTSLDLISKHSANAAAHSLRREETHDYSLR